MPTKRNSKKNQGGGREAAREMGLRDLFTTKMKALYDIEQQLVKALPKMAKSATDDDLRMGFERHLKQTEEHVRRLEQAFERLGMRPQKLQCDGIRGIIADAEWGVKNVKGDAALDANLIAAAQYAEHYEMAGYNSAIAWAKRLGEDEIADALQETLDEEQETSETLAELAGSKIDEEATSADDEGNTSGVNGEEDMEDDEEEGK